MDELEYLTESRDASQFVGIWVAMVGKEILAKGEILKDVIAEAKRKKPDEELFVMKLPKNRVMLM